MYILYLVVLILAFVDLATIHLSYSYFIIKRDLVTATKNYLRFNGSS